MIDEAPSEDMAETPRQAGRATRRHGWVEQYDPFWVKLLTVLFTPIFRYWVRYFRWFDVENVPPTGGMFLICNHTTAMDPFLVGFSMRHRVFRGPGRVELFKYRIPAYIMRKIGMFPLRQRVADAAAVRTIFELIRGEQMVLVFPEGGRSRDGQLQPMIPGFVRLALKLKVPLVPMAIAGGTDLMPMGKVIPKRNTPVAAVYGTPFDLSAFYGRPITPDLVEEVAKVMHDRMAEQLERAREERARIAAENGIELPSP